MLILAALVLGGFAVKAPLALARIHLTPDSIGYLNIAGNLASGRGFVSTIRLHYLDHSPVTHGAFSDCPPLYPVFAAGIMRCGGSATTLMLLNLLLVCVASGLVFLIGERLFDSRSGLVTGTAAALAPNLFHSGLTAMSDPLALVLALGAFVLVTAGKVSTRQWIAAGTLLGLATLTRYPYALLGLAVLVFAAAGPWGKRNGLACAAGVLPTSAFAAAFSPPVQKLHYCVASFQAAMRNYGTQVDPLYWLHHPLYVVCSVAHNLAHYSLDLTFGFRGLFLLGLGLIVWLGRQGKDTLRREHKLALIVAGLNLVIYASTWSIPPVRGSRFLLLSYCLLLPFCAVGLIHILAGRSRIARMAAAAACVATAGVYIWGCVTAAAFTGGDCIPLTRREVAMMDAQLPANAVVASNNPWVLNYSTGMPSALLQYKLNRADLLRLVRKYRINGIILVTPVPDDKTIQVLGACYPEKRLSARIAMYQTTARTRTTDD